MFRLIRPRERILSVFLDEAYQCRTVAIVPASVLRLVIYFIVVATPSYLPSLFSGSNFPSSASVDNFLSFDKHGRGAPVLPQSPLNLFPQTTQCNGQRATQVSLEFS